MKRLRLALLAGAIGLLPSCMTTYDAQGRPVQSVDPAAAAAIAVGAAAIGYAAGDDNDKVYVRRPYYGHYPRRYYRGRGRW